MHNRLQDSFWSHFSLVRGVRSLGNPEKELQIDNRLSYFPACGPDRCPQAGSAATEQTLRDAIRTSVQALADAATA